MRKLMTLVAVAPLVGAAACSSGHATSAGSTGATAPKPSGDPIKIAIIVDASRPGGIKTPEIQEAARARVQAINAAGGINGRPVQLFECDSKTDPNAARACARQVVSGGNVAVVGMVAGSEAASVPILEQAKVPIIGVTATSSAAGDSRVAFCFNGGGLSTYAGTVAALQADGAKKVALLYPSDLGGTSATTKSAFETGLTKTGIMNAGIVGFNYGDSQFDAVVAKAVSSGADGVVAAAPGATQGSLIQAIRQQAPNMKIAAPSVALTPDVLKALGAEADGISVVSYVQPATATDVSGIKQMVADVDKYQPGIPLTDHAINAWAAVWAFEKVASKLSSITRGSVLQAMNELHGLDLGGMYPPLSASNRSSKLPGLGCSMNTQVVFDKIEDGKVVAVDPGKFYNLFG